MAIPLARGAEGVLSKAKFLGLDAVVKDRVQKGYRVKELDLKLRRGRTLAEARLLNEAKKAGVKCPIVYSVGRNELVVSFVDGELLRSVLARNDAGAAKVLGRTGEALGKLHSAGIVHGDFTTANVIVSKGEPWVIDFGLGGFSGDLEEKAIDVLLMKRSLGRKEYAAFLKGYLKHDGAKKALKRLDDVEMRGRYVVRRMAD